MNGSFAFLFSLWFLGYELTGLARGGEQLSRLKRNYARAVELLVELASLQVGAMSQIYLSSACKSVHCYTLQHKHVNYVFRESLFIFRSLYLSSAPALHQPAFTLDFCLHASYLCMNIKYNVKL